MLECFKGKDGASPSPEGRRGQGESGPLSAALTPNYPLGKEKATANLLSGWKKKEEFGL